MANHSPKETAYFTGLSTTTVLKKNGLCQDMLSKNIRSLRTKTYSSSSTNIKITIMDCISNCDKPLEFSFPHLHSQELYMYALINGFLIKLWSKILLKAKRLNCQLKIFIGDNLHDQGPLQRNYQTVSLSGENLRLI